MAFFWFIFQRSLCTIHGWYSSKATMTWGVFDEQLLRNHEVFSCLWRTISQNKFISFWGFLILLSIKTSIKIFQFSLGTCPIRHEYFRKGGNALLQGEMSLPEKLRVCYLFMKVRPAPEVRPPQCRGEAQGQPSRNSGSRSAAGGLGLVTTRRWGEEGNPKSSFAGNFRACSPQNTWPKGNRPPPAERAEPWEAA